MSNLLRVSEFADRIGRSASTVRRWEREGLISPGRTVSGQRYFTETDVLAVLRPGFGTTPRGVVVYSRVSSSGQRNDLASQVAAMERFCEGRGLAVTEWVSEVGGGMNFRRRKFLALLDKIIAGEVSTVVVAHQDRLARFGFELIEWLATKHGCEIIVANQETLSPQQELVEDLLAIVHVFSCRLYGLRRYEKQLKADGVALALPAEVVSS
jgi:predicted site-specific integrase-resolvase